MGGMSSISESGRRLNAVAATLFLMAGMLVVLLAADTGAAVADGCESSGSANLDRGSSSYNVGQNCPGSTGSPGKSGGRATAVNLDPNREVCFTRPSKGGVYNVAEPPAGQTAATGGSVDRFCGKASEIAAMQASADPLDACTGSCGAQYGTWVENSAPTPEEVATSLLASLNLTAPKIHTNPEADRHLLVAWPTWLWIDGDNSTQTASDGPISITARQSVKWSTDQGPVPCTGPGTPYVPGRSDPKKPSPDCGFTFTTPGSHSITAAVTWAVTVGGAAVTLPATVFTVTRPVQVDEVQTVNR